jgi:RNA polymerase sigma-70 factor, ECF subfamily
VIDWNAIIRANGPAVWRTLYRVLGNRADADECFQDVFLAAVKTSRRRDIRNWPAWLNRLAVSRAIDQLRRRKRFALQGDCLPLEEIVSAEPGAGMQAQDQERIEQLRRALTQLPAPQAEAITLHLLEGCSYQEIAGELSLTVSAVGVLIHRGKAKLRKLLQDASGVRSGGLP